MDHLSIIKDIKAGNHSPLYVLHGEEPYYIDLITASLVENAVAPEEKDMNLFVVYGKDAETGNLIAQANEFSMFGGKKVIVLKEAQDFKKIDELEKYFENPSENSIFVVNYKYKAINGRSKLLKAAAKSGVVFKSEKIRDYKLPDWISNHVKSLGYGITSKASMLLCDFLGADLSKITNEIDKLTILIEKGTTINDVHIEENIGISKDFNVFELTKAIGVRDVPKVFQIVQYFEHNPKSVHISQMIPTLFNYFGSLMRVHFLPVKSKEAVAQACKVHPFFAQEYIAAAKVYNPKKLAANIAILHEYDLRSKGVENSSSTDGELMREMMFRLLH